MRRLRTTSRLAKLTVKTLLPVTGVVGTDEGVIVGVTKGLMAEPPVVSQEAPAVFWVLWK